jgi:hypothetical protein
MLSSLHVYMLTAGDIFFPSFFWGGEVGGKGLSCAAYIS